MSRVFAYCRVSTLEQNTENQRREIEAAGFTVKSQRLIEERTSVVRLLPVSGPDLPVCSTEWKMVTC